MGQNSSRPIFPRRTLPYPRGPIPDTPSNHVILYNQPNFLGESIKFNRGFHNLNPPWINNVRSLVLGPSTQVTLYGVTNEGLQISRTYKSQPVPSLDFNVTSLRVSHEYNREGFGTASDFLGIIIFVILLIFIIYLFRGY